MNPKFRRDFKNNMLATWSDEEEVVEDDPVATTTTMLDSRVEVPLSLPKKMKKGWPKMNGRMTLASWP